MMKKTLSLLLVLTFLIASVAGTYAVTKKTKIYIEAEKGKLAGAWQILDDAKASKGKYISTPVETAVADPASTATYTFKVPKTGKYNLWLRVKCDNTTSHNSFLYTIDGKPKEMAIFDCSDGDYPDWYWLRFNNRNGTKDDGSPLRFVEQTFKLKAGKHTLVLCEREPFAAADRILITDDLKFKPRPAWKGSETPCPSPK